MSELEDKQQLDALRERAAADGCVHTNPLRVRLIDYTRYGTWVGCMRCGRSWLIRLPVGSASGPR